MSWTEKQYARINWQNRPSTATALGATNLNKIDVFCNSVDNELITMDAGKLDIATANGMLKSLSIDTSTGIITATQLDGTKYRWDLNVEKIPVSFALDANGILTMTTDDGTVFTADIPNLIKDYVYDDSDTIGFTKEFNSTDQSGKGSYHVTAIVKEGSINAKHLNPDYLANINTYMTTAQTAASDALTYSKDSKRWAVGDDAYQGSDVDNSKYYKEQAEAAKAAAEEARDEAVAATGIKIMTTSEIGVGKPDGVTIDVNENGTFYSLPAAINLVTFSASSWSTASDGTYTQSVAASWISADDTPIPLLVDDSTTESNSKAKRKAYGYISYFNSASGTVTAVCKYKMPTVDLTIGFKGV